MTTRELLTGVTLASALVLTSAAEATTVGLWLFDGSTVDTNLPTGTEFRDISGNDLGFVYTDESPALTIPKVQLTSDVPAAIGVGTALTVPIGIGRVIDTPGSSLLHPANTGEFTVEFWHKNLNLGFQNVLGPVAMASPGGGGQEPNRWQITTGIGNLGVGSPTGYEYDGTFYGTTGGGGNRTRVTTTQDWNVPDVWKHFALTASQSTGELIIYVDGVQVASATGLVAQTAISQPLRLLANAATTNFGGNAQIDELRISDVVLLPGEGTGDGELAWNASLIPEPATLGLMVLGGLAMLNRRR